MKDTKIIRHSPFVKIILLVVVFAVVTAILATGLPVKASAQTVGPTPSTVFVNGAATEFEAYLIDGNNFFKLRDLAYALNGTNKQFSIGYDAATRAITLTTGQPYEPDGSEMAPGDGTSKSAALNTAINISKDGVPVEITAYLIGGNNFMRLRDVMRLLDIGVGYDNATRNITIVTSIGYTEDTPTPETTPRPAIGDIIPFGGYDWRVLDVQDSHALIITENIISYRRYHSSQVDVTWETSAMRRYLNGEFFNSLSVADRGRIRETTVINNDTDRPWDFIYGYGADAVPGGNNTTDRIFLLSTEEVVQYFGDSGQLANLANRSPDDFSMWIRDEYNEARIARDSSGSASTWWLRSPGTVPDSAVAVNADGAIGLFGMHVFEMFELEGIVDGSGVRPALWLNLES